MRQREGSVLCSSCHRLVYVGEESCPHCGARAPGLWGFGPALRRVFGRTALVEVGVLGACGALYVLSLLIEPSAVLGGGGLFSLGAPGYEALRALGMTGGEAWALGHHWTLLTSIWLHGSLLHLGFNLLWARTLLPMGAEAFGAGRLVVLWCVTGAAGMLLSNAVTGVPTIGASGAVFGLLGGLWTWGRRRGGTVGAEVSGQVWGWAVFALLLGALAPQVNNAAHVGGLLTGAVLGLVLPNQERRRENRRAQVGALVLLALTALGFGLSLWRWGLPIL